VAYSALLARQQCTTAPDLEEPGKWSQTYLKTFHVDMGDSV
jgi:hypothetical protein